MLNFLYISPGYIGMEIQTFGKIKAVFYIAGIILHAANPGCTAGLLY